MEQHLFQPCLILNSSNWNHCLHRMWSLTMLTAALQGAGVRVPWWEEQFICTKSVRPSLFLQHSLRLTWESMDLPHPRGQEKALTGKACCSQEAVVLKTFKEDSHSCQWAWQVFHFLFGAAQLCRLLSFTCKSNHHPSFTLLFFFSQRIAIERCSVLKSPESPR